MGSRFGPSHASCARSAGECRELAAHVRHELTIPASQRSPETGATHHGRRKLVHRAHDAPRPREWATPCSVAFRCRSATVFPPPGRHEPRGTPNQCAIPTRSRSEKVIRPQAMRYPGAHTHSAGPPGDRPKPRLPVRGYLLDTRRGNDYSSFVSFFFDTEPRSSASRACFFACSITSGWKSFCIASSLVSSCAFLSRGF